MSSVKPHLSFGDYIERYVCLSEEPEEESTLAEIKRRLENGEDVNDPIGWGSSIIEIVIVNNLEKIFDIIIEYDVDLKTTIPFPSLDDPEYTPLELSRLGGKRKYMESKILEKLNRET